MMHAMNLPLAFATATSHFAVGLPAGGMKPVSSPPHGVCALDAPTHRRLTDSAATTNAVRNMQTLLPSTTLRGTGTPAAAWPVGINRHPVGRDLLDERSTRRSTV